MEGWDEEMDGRMNALCYVMCIATCCLPCKYVLYKYLIRGQVGRYVLSPACTVHWAIISNQQ